MFHFNINTILIYVLQKHVQALLEDEGANVTRMLLEDQGHFYVCGDCKMAEEVKQKLREIISSNSNMTEDEAEEFILNLMVIIFN